MLVVCDADRYVIVGNHYDAFVLGAVDPNSGTAVMLELSRAFAKLHRQGQLTICKVAFKYRIMHKQTFIRTVIAFQPN